MQAAINGASDPKTNAFASAMGIGAALISVTGVFGEVQASLNAIWKVTSNRSVPTRLMRARLASLGLVVTSGFLLSVSLVVSAALAAASIYLKAMFPACDNVASTYGTAGALVVLLVWI